jgi:N-acyl-L-homoserine lactone synthetase
MVKKTDKNLELIKKAARLLKGETLTNEQKNLYALHAKKIHKIKRLKIHVHQKNEQWSIDLADLNELSGYNNQYRYILVCVDVGTRYAFVKLLKTKSAKNVSVKFEEIIRENAPPKKIQADEGTEFNDIKKTCLKNIISNYFIRKIVK